MNYAGLLTNLEQMNIFSASIHAVNLYYIRPCVCLRLLAVQSCKLHDSYSTHLTRALDLRRACGPIGLALGLHGVNSTFWDFFSSCGTTLTQFCGTIEQF